jgi:tetratricopeptide (TPR) repeat protein
MFRVLGQHPGPDLSRAAAASLLGADLGRAGRALAELTRVHMATAQPGGRFELHDLLRAYATEQATLVDPAAQRDRAAVRMVDHYLHTAYAAARLFQAGRTPLQLVPPQPGVTAETLADRPAALAWLGRERPALLAVIDRAAAMGLDHHVWQLVWALAPYLDRHGFWTEWAACERLALAATERLGDQGAQAHTHQRLGHLHGRLGATRLADEHLDTALRLFRRAGDPVGEARAHISQAWRLDQRGEVRSALDHAERAVTLFESADDRAGQLDALSCLGWLHAKSGDHRQGLAHCERARDLYREVDDPLGEAAAWDSIGYINHQMGRHRVAVASYRRSLVLVDRLGGRLHQAEVRLHLGDVHRDAGDLSAARDVWRQALAGLDELQHPEAARLRDKIAQLGGEPG